MDSIANEYSQLLKENQGAPDQNTTAAETKELGFNDQSTRQSPKISEIQTRSATSSARKEQN